jgi:glycopeptide antibiotics resistance protein
MKSLSKILLAVYLLTLSWLVLFKFSYDLPGVLHHQMRSLNLNPFTTSGQGSPREILDNFIVFIPYGLLLSVNFKQITVWHKLFLIFIFSLVAEIISIK